MVDEGLTQQGVELVAKWFSISRPTIPFAITGVAPATVEVLEGAGAADPDGAEIPEVFPSAPSTGKRYDATLKVSQSPPATVSSNLRVKYPHAKAIGSLKSLLRL
ncbi:hypothetical protein EKN06_00445 [Croceicoccus ponticola]|uniref:Uncharacterized protein n=1 Tax=Croceicoccus ponticola TaxID=2217664 RepID=A0A437GZE8_9SPHN|nr:hypothetical protein [Croceicoccus ponticola]RVQ68738.1 hypothetical protein EKN06_00445 [Croceicoccus ponticola]